MGWLLAILSVVLLVLVGEHGGEERVASWLRLSNVRIGNARELYSLCGEPG
jgi:hypothetical protein